MNKIDCIVALGGVLTKLDVRRGSMSPGLPARNHLDELRDQISGYQIELADLIFDEGNQTYTDITKELQLVIETVESELEDIDNILNVIASITDLLDIVDNLFLLAIDIG